MSRSDDSALRRHAVRLARSPQGTALVATWSLAEAISWPLLAEVPLAVLCVADPRSGVRLSVAAAIASVAGGAATYGLAARGTIPPRPLTTPRMIAQVASETAEEGAQAVRHQPLAGIPYKVYAAQAGADRVGLLPFLGASAQARGARILLSGLALSGFGAVARRHRHRYAQYLTVFAIGFTAGLAAIVRRWS